MKGNTRGFTLIELLVVVGIIAVLAAVTTASLIAARVKGRDTRRVEDVHQIHTALALYFADCKRFPATLVTTANNGCPSGINLGTFLNTIPLDPQTNSPYSYAALGVGLNCSSYHIGAVLELATTPALATDRDHAPGTICTGSNPDFHGLSEGVTNPRACTATAGTGAPAGTERCYDVKP